MKRCEIKVTSIPKKHLNQCLTASFL
jgi:hypothetical protein